MWGAVHYPVVGTLPKIKNALNQNTTIIISTRTKSILNCPLKQNLYYFGSPKLKLSSPSSLSCSSSSSSYGADQGPLEDNNNLNPLVEENQQSENKGLWKKWREKSGEMSSKLAKLGLSAVLAYGVFDAVTYTSFFVLAFLGYEKSTGQNPAANLKALIGIVILMWTGNNVTRPFRVAGAAAFAPIIDKGLKKIQKYFNFPSLVYAFALVVGIVATPCLAVVGVLILSRWGK